MKKYTAAFSTLEYIVLLTFIIGGFIAMGPYITNAFNGYFRRAGEGMDYHRQHHPFRTRDCMWDPRLGSGAWYAVKCYNHQVAIHNCETGTADNMDAVIWCRLHATNAALCTGTGGIIMVNGTPVNVLTTCPTTCCMTLAKSTCLGPCRSMPAP